MGCHLESIFSPFNFSQFSTGCLYAILTTDCVSAFFNSLTVWRYVWPFRHGLRPSRSSFHFSRVERLRTCTMFFFLFLWGSATVCGWWRCFVAPRLLIEQNCLHWSLSCLRGFELIKPTTSVATFIQHNCLFLVSLDSLFRPVSYTRALVLL